MSDFLSQKATQRRKPREKSVVFTFRLIHLNHGFLICTMGMLTPHRQSGCCGNLCQLSSYNNSLLLFSSSTSDFFHSTNHNLELFIFLLL